MEPGLQQLESDLENALQVHRQAHAEYGSALAVKAVIDFIRASGLRPELARPLAEIVTSFSDQYSDKNLKPHSESLRWGSAAAGIEVLKRTGVPLTEAATKVARAIGGGVTAKELIEFRKNIGKGRAREDAIQAHRRVVTMFTKGYPLNQRERGVLHFLRTQYATPKKG